MTRIWIAIRMLAAKEIKEINLEFFLIIVSIAKRKIQDTLPRFPLISDLFYKEFFLKISNQTIFYFQHQEPKANRNSKISERNKRR